MGYSALLAAKIKVAPIKQVTPSPTLLVRLASRLQRVAPV